MLHESCNSGSSGLGFEDMQIRANCQEGTLQYASGMDLVQDGTELPAGVYVFTPAKATGMSSTSTL